MLVRFEALPAVAGATLAHAFRQPDGSLLAQYQFGNSLTAHTKQTPAFVSIQALTHRCLLRRGSSAITMRLVSYRHLYATPEEFAGLLELVARIPSPRAAEVCLERRRNRTATIHR